MVCKLYIFWTCSENLAILIFEDICSFHIAESSKTTISYFFFQLCPSCMYILQVLSRNCTLHVIHRQCLRKKVICYISKSYYQLFTTIVSYFCSAVNGISLAYKIPIFWKCLEAYCQAIFTFDAF